MQYNLGLDLGKRRDHAALAMDAKVCVGRAILPAAAFQAAITGCSARQPEKFPESAKRTPHTAWRSIGQGSRNLYAPCKLKPLPNAPRTGNFRSRHPKPHH